MKTITIFLLLVLGTVVTCPVQGQELIYTNRIDSSLYDFGYSDIVVRVYPGPEISYIVHAGSMASTQTFYARKKKGDDQWDLFSFKGKIGTVTIPPIYEEYSIVFVSQTFIDSDDGWEYIVNTNDFDGPFSVVDDDLSVLLSGNGRGIEYGFDGQNTYVLQGPPSIAFPDDEQKVWRFRTNVSSSAPPSLSKTGTSPLHPIMTYGPSGNYRISLAPSGGGKTTLQLFDMLGRCVFARQIDNITQPVTFTIPEDNVPRSPFVAKVTEGKRSHIQREIPVR